MPALGGTIRQIALLSCSGREPVTILEQDSDDELAINPWFRGRFLFPFNDRIPSGCYSFDDKTYEVPVNDPGGEDAIHGFIYSLPVSGPVLTQTEEQAVIKWQIGLEKRNEYPFNPLLKISILFRKGYLKIFSEIENVGNNTLPFAFGWHPYFRFGNNSGNIDNYRLQIPASCFIEVDDKLLPTGEIPPTAGTGFDFSKARKIGYSELDTGFTGLDGGCRLEFGNLEIFLNQDLGAFPYIQAFIPPDRRSIAIEPVTGGTNSFNMPEMGLSELQPGENWNGWFAVELDEK